MHYQNKTTPINVTVQGGLPGENPPGSKSRNLIGSQEKAKISKTSQMENIPRKTDKSECGCTSLKEAKKNKKPNRGNQKKGGTF